MINPLRHTSKNGVGVLFVFNDTIYIYIYIYESERESR